MPPDISQAKSSSEYTLWDESKIKPQETTREQLRSDVGQNYLEEKEKKEHKSLLSKEEFLVL